MYVTEREKKNRARYSAVRGSRKRKRVAEGGVPQKGVRCCSGGVAGPTCVAVEQSSEVVRRRTNRNVSSSCSR